MPFYDKATQAAIDRFDAETGSSHQLADIRSNPRFQALLAEEDSKVVSENPKSPFASTPCPSGVKKHNPNCKVDALQITKNESRRLLVNSQNNGAVLEVVGGNLEWLSQRVAFLNFNPAKIQARPVGLQLKGPCSTSGSHQDKTFDVPYLNVKAKTDSLLEFHAFSDWVFFPWNAEPKKYRIKYNTCSQSLRSEVHVYPDVEFGVGFEFKFQHELGRKFTEKKLNISDADKAAQTRYDMAQLDLAASRDAETETLLQPIKSGKRHKLLKSVNRDIRRSQQEIAELASKESELGWATTSSRKIKFTKAISLFGFYKFSGQEIELKHVFKDVIERTKPIEKFVEHIESFVTKIQELAQENEDSAGELAERKLTKAKSGVSITYPTFGMKMSGLWEELEGEPECQYGASFSLFFKPLIGIEFKFDITYAVLKALGPFGNTVSKIKQALEDRDISTVAIVISASAKINTEARIEMNTQTQTNNPGIQLQLDIAVKLEIKVVQFRKRILKYEVVVDIGGSGESGVIFTIKMNMKKAVLDTEWSGIKATIISHTTITKSTEASGTPPKAPLPPLPAVPNYQAKKQEIGKGVSQTDSEEHEKTFKMKGVKFKPVDLCTFTP